MSIKIIILLIGIGGFFILKMVHNQNRHIKRDFTKKRTFLKSKIQLNRMQINLRNENLNKYNFLKYNLNESLIAQSNIEI